MKEEKSPDIKLVGNIINQKPIQKFQSALKKNPLFFASLVLSIIAIAVLVIPITRLYQKTNVAFQERALVFDLYREAEAQLKAKNNELYLSKMQKTFTDDQLMKMIDRHTTYKLFINNKVAEKNTSIFYSNSDTTLITFYEQYAANAKDFIPDELLNKYSKINKTEIEKLIKISTNEAKYTMTEQQYEDGRKLYIQFDAVKPGEIITLDLENKFAKTLGMDEYSIEIFYNKAA